MDCAQSNGFYNKEIKYLEQMEVRLIMGERYRTYCPNEKNYLYNGKRQKRLKSSLRSLARLGGASFLSFLTEFCMVAARQDTGNM